MQLRRSKNLGDLRSRRGIEKYAASYVALAPFYILFFVFILIPMVQGVAMSFTDWSTSSRGVINFVGLENYISIFSGRGSASKRFLTSLNNLLIYVPITITVGLSISLMLALVVNQFHNKIYSFFRGAYFFPTVMPLFLGAGIWQWYMASDTGLVASNLASLGIGANTVWRDTAGYAIALVVIIDVWHAVGFNFVIFSTGMQDIPRELYEAAEIDGANTFQKMRRITIPLLEPILFFVITYSFISALQVYDIPWIITNGTDINSIGGAKQVMLFPVMEMVKNVYQGGKSALARASAEGVILMVIILTITVVQFKLRRKKV